VGTNWYPRDKFLPAMYILILNHGKCKGLK
jgi:hypothetical protein